MRKTKQQILSIVQSKWNLQSFDDLAEPSKQKRVPSEKSFLRISYVKDEKVLHIKQSDPPLYSFEIAQEQARYELNDGSR